MYYNARFVQPGTIISSYANPQTLDRFSDVLNNPILLKRWVIIFTSRVAAESPQRFNMSVLQLYLITGVPILVGLAIIFKESGWPSERERNARGLRSIRTGLGGALLVAGLIILLIYRSSPGRLIADIFARSTLSFAFLVIVPIFLISVAGAYVGYSVRDRAEPAARERQRRIVEAEKNRKRDS